MIDPKSLKVGMSIKIDDTLPIILSTFINKSQLEFSKDMEFTIEDITTFYFKNIPFTGLYLNDGSKLYYCYEGNIIKEIFYFKKIQEIYPQTEEEWSMWIEPNKGLLGMQDAISPDGIKYLRVFGDNSPWFEPIKINELNRTNNLSVRKIGMFSRDLEQGKIEYINMEHLSGSYGHLIEIYIGINLEQTDIK